MAFVLGEIFGATDSNIFWIFAVCSILYIILFLAYNKYYFILGLIILCFFTLGNIFMINMKKNLEPEEEIKKSANVIIEGNTEELVKRNERYYLYLKNARVSVEEISIKYDKALIYFDDNIEVKYGNKVRIQGIYKEFSKARNPGNYDEGNYYNSLGIFCKFYGKSFVVTDYHYNCLMETLIHIKESLIKSVYSVCNEKEASVFCAILFGEKADIDNSTKALYQDNGIAHILAISGLHISILGIGIYTLLRRKLLFVSSAVVSSIIMICFGMMTGGAVSITRAVIMFIIKLISDVLGRTYDMLIAVSVAALLVLTENPYYIYNYGFLLSFLAIISIAILTPITERFFDISSKFLKAINVSTVVTIVTTPVILNIYFQFPLYSIFINLIVIPLMGIVLLSGLSASLAGTLFVNLGYFFIGIGFYILRFYELLCYIFLSLPFSTIIVGKLSFIRIFLYYIMTALFAMIMHIVGKLNLDNNFWKIRYAKRSLCIIFLMSVMAIFFLKPQCKLMISMLDVGQGECSLIQTPEGKILCIDGGSTDIKNVARYRIIPTIKSQGISHIDYFCITHMDDDHVNGLMEILNNYKKFNIEIKNIILSDRILKDEVFEKFIDMAKDCGINIEYMKSGTEITDGTVKIKCLYPSQFFNSDDKNANSLVLSLEYNKFSMLFTGDIDSYAEQILINSDLLMDYDILKIAHHGSDKSTKKEFLEITRPEYAIISCGIDNIYGHPHAATLEKLKNIHANIYVTNDCGAVKIISDGDTYSVSAFIKS